MVKIGWRLIETPHPFRIDAGGKLQREALEAVR
jgi:hypothetical protein